MAASPNVIILPSLLRGDEFYQYRLQGMWHSSGDETFMAYDIYEYGLRTTHIMMESLWLGRMIIVAEIPVCLLTVIRLVF